MDALQGDLDSFSLADVVRLLATAGGTGVLRIERGAMTGRVFFVDGDKILGLNLADGKEAWRARRPNVPEHKMRYNIRITDMTTLVWADGVVYFAQLNPARGIDWREIRGMVHAFSAKTGKKLWTADDKGTESSATDSSTGGSESDAADT